MAQFAPRPIAGVFRRHASTRLVATREKVRARAHGFSRIFPGFGKSRGERGGAVFGGFEKFIFARIRERRRYVKEVTRRPVLFRSECESVRERGSVRERARPRAIFTREGYSRDCCCCACRRRWKWRVWGGVCV